ncbi:hypothetical protein DL98DRAFT_564136 [Cadophora sp. DSE1049]|nr:hypothetical protein DL98DRAFT_564136 [Cadophora sp. DSE1049]
MAVEEASRSHRDRGQALDILGIALRGRFIRNGVMKDIEEAVKSARAAVEATPHNDPERANRLGNLGNCLSKRFQRTGQIADIDEAIVLTGMALEATPPEHPDRARKLRNLGSLLGRRFERTGVLEDVNRAISLTKTAVEITPPGHPERAGRLNNLGGLLDMRSERLGLIEDLDRAVEVAEEAVDTTPSDHSDRASQLNNLGNQLGRRFDHTGAMHDLNRAIDMADEAVGATPLDHPDRVSRLVNLGSLLGRRYDRLGAIADLSRALDVVEEAVRATALDDAKRAGWLNNLGSLLGSRYQRTGAVEDLDRAIKVSETAVEITPPGHPGRAGQLSNLGILLSWRHKQAGTIEDLERAISIAETALDLTPRGHPDRIARLNSLGIRLSMLFKETGAIEQLDRAVNVSEEATNATPPGHPLRAMLENNLGYLLGRRFQRTGTIEDLDRAVDLTKIAVDNTPHDSSGRAGWLNNLGLWLGVRSERTGAMEDIERAVEAAEMALDATPLDHPDRFDYTINLGRWLNLNRALEANRNALSYRTPRDTRKVLDILPIHIPDNLAASVETWMDQRYRLTEDIRAAIEVAQRIVNDTPLKHPDRGSRLNNLGNLLSMQVDQTGEMGDLDRAIDTAAMAIEATPLGHPSRARCLSNLGQRLRQRFELNGAKEDRDHAPPSDRIRAARCAADFLMSQSEWEESSTLLRDAVELLPAHMLIDFAGLASTAAASALSAGKEPHQALEVLELGRGVIAGLLLELRTDLTKLHKKHSALAKEFESLREELNAPVNDMSLFAADESGASWETQAKRRREAAQRFSEITDKIRDKLGFQSFLRLPKKEEVMAEAESGPIVIINLSSYRCDAFLVERCQITALPLPELSLKEVEDRAKKLRSDLTTTLAWLWRIIVCPCLKALGVTQPHSGSGHWPRVWWIPTGVLSHFPIHAAGRHFDSSGETALDRVVSSYSSSIKALIYGRQQHVQCPAPSGLEEALLISMEETPGQSALRFAAREVAMLEDLCPSLPLWPVQTLHKCREDVLARLRTCKTFHFAGHAESDPWEPSRSRLMLEDWKTKPLTVADLRDHWLQGNSPFLAYLSACSTGANRVERLTDESIHLISACQLAGFRHVVGTLWEVDDEYSVDAARVVYEAIRDMRWSNEAVALGVHNAARLLREKTGGAGGTNSQEDVAKNAQDPREGVAPTVEMGARSRSTRGVVGSALPEEGIPAIWAPYVHFGP